MAIQFYLPIIILALTLLFNMPITYGMLASGAFYLLLSGADIGMIVDQVMGTMFTGYVLMAVPLFIFTANVMNSGKVTDSMFEFCKGLIGRRRGALAYVNVLISLIFSGMTGSAIADASGIGIIEINAMKNDGYDKPFSCALTAASATIGPIFPPSIPFVIYAMLSGASVGALFLGGMIPGLVIAIALTFYISYISKKRNYPRGSHYNFKEFVKFTFKAFPALLTPVILLVGIYTGIVTPTEAGAIAAFYALIIAIFAYKVLSFKNFVQTLKDTALQTGAITILTGAASVFSYIVARENMPAMIADFMMSVTSNKYLILLFFNVLFLILGMFLDTSTLQFIFIPMVLPIVNAVGINLVHFGVVISLNMMIGLSTPPFGFLLFITSGISKTPLVDIIREILPMVLVLLVVLFLITFIPDIVLFMPRLMG
jgi:tripartite ATP-independent transporter DctM subunit